MTSASRPAHNKTYKPPSMGVIAEQFRQQAPRCCRPLDRPHNVQGTTPGAAGAWTTRPPDSTYSTPASQSLRRLRRPRKTPRPGGPPRTRPSSSTGTWPAFAARRPHRRLRTLRRPAARDSPTAPRARPPRPRSGHFTRSECYVKHPLVLTPTWLGPTHIVSEIGGDWARQHRGSYAKSRRRQTTPRRRATASC